jgi:hypothetical protein
MAVLTAVVVDCHEPPERARFWAGVVQGYAVRAYDDAEVSQLASLGFSPETDPTDAVDGPGPTLFFQTVPEGKTSKNRVHLDIEVPDREGRALTIRAAERGPPGRTRTCDMRIRRTFAA